MSTKTQAQRIAEAGDELRFMAKQFLAKSILDRPTGSVEKKRMEEAIAAMNKALSKPFIEKELESTPSSSVVEVEQCLRTLLFIDTNALDQREVAGVLNRILDKTIPVLRTALSAISNAARSPQTGRVLTDEQYPKAGRSYTTRMGIAKMLGREFRDTHLMPLLEKGVSQNEIGVRQQCFCEGVLQAIKHVVDEGYLSPVHPTSQTRGGEVVAWTTKLALECSEKLAGTPHEVIDACRRNLWGENGVPLIVAPSPQVGQEGSEPLMYEDQLPDMTKDEYSAWYKQSKIVDGVRMGPVFPPAPPNVEPNT